MTKRFAILLLPLAIGLIGCETHQSLDAAPAEPGKALRTSVDLARGTRWELDWGTLTARDLASGATLRTVELTGGNFSLARESCLPDMVLSRTGAAFVSSNVQPTLWRVSPARYEVERFDIEVDSDAHKDFGFTALAWGPNEAALFALGAPTGTVWRIDLATGKATKVDQVPPFHGAC